MKTRFFSLSALAVAAIALFGCDKTSVEIVKADNVPFEFIASEITKTTNDGAHTNWVADDQVSLFHAVAGGDSYVKDGAFTAAASGASTNFTGSLASELTADNYDWYAIYPYNSNIGTPANHGTKGYVTVGSASNAKQAQTGNSNMAHIAGSNYPVAGKVLNVAKETNPVIPMSHLSSLVAVKVTNGTSGPITVSQVAFTGTEDIVGTYYIDFVSSPVVYTSSGPTYVSSTATLQVTGGDTIAKDASATFYLAVKPFTAVKDGTITLSVTADNGEQTINKVLASDFTFAAGQKNTLNFTYNKEVEAAAYTLTFDSTSMQSSVNNYTTESWNTKCDGFTWSLGYFNNNNKGWTYVKGGNKTSASVATITTASAMTEAISKVSLTLSAITAASVNSIKLKVATDSGFTAGLQEVTGSKTTGTQDFEVPVPTANCYYRLEFDCKKGSSNGLVTVTKVEYFE